MQCDSVQLSITFSSLKEGTLVAQLHEAVLTSAGGSQATVTALLDSGQEITAPRHAFVLMDEELQPAPEKKRKKDKKKTSFYNLI